MEAPIPPQRPDTMIGKRLTRRRVPVSCVACRVRKSVIHVQLRGLSYSHWYINRLKCNRETPCQNCVVRGESNTAACTYAQKSDGKSKSNPRSDPETMRKRINRLESSILSIMNGDTSINQANMAKNDLNHQKRMSDTPVIYSLSLDSRSTHWDTILHDVSWLAFRNVTICCENRSKLVHFFSFSFELASKHYLPLNCIWAFRKRWLKFSLVMWFHRSCIWIAAHQEAQIYTFTISYKPLKDYLT